MSLTLLIFTIAILSFIGGLVLGFQTGKKFHAKYIAPRTLEEASRQVAEALLKKEGYQVIKEGPKREWISPLRVIGFLFAVAILLLLWLLFQSGWLKG